MQVKRTDWLELQRSFYRADALETRQTSKHGRKMSFPFDRQPIYGPAPGSPNPCERRVCRTQQICGHSGESGARQWRRLMDELKDSYRVRAVNLFGWGGTPPWPADAKQSIFDQAKLVERPIPRDTYNFSLVGHSQGALIAMKLAARLGGRVTKLVLLEPNPFNLLRQAGRSQADPFRRAAEYFNLIFKDEKPSELPVQAPTKYELAINLKTAKALGRAIPVDLIARANEIIE